MLAVLLVVLAPAPSVASEPFAEARARLAQADSMYVHGRYAAMESLATAVRTDLERAPRADSLLLARAWLDVSHSRWQRSGLADSICLHAAEHCLALLDGRRDAPDTMLFVAHRDAGDACSSMGRSRSGLAHLRAALAIVRRRQEWGGLPLSVVLFSLGQTLTNAGATDSARVVLEEALAVRTRLGLPRDTLPGRILSELGWIYQLRGDYDLAERSYRDAVGAIESRAGANAIDAAYPLSRLASLQMFEGDYAGSIESTQRALRVYQPFSRPDSPNWNILRGILAQSLDRLGELEQARAIFEEILPHLEAAMGRENPQVLTARLSLAAACARLGYSSRAIELCEQIRETFARDSNLDYTSLEAAALETEAEILDTQGRADSALAVALQAEKVSEGLRYAVITLQALSVELKSRARRREWDQVDRVETRIDSLMIRFTGLGAGESDQVWTARSEVAEWRGRHADAVRTAADGARAARKRLIANTRTLSDRQALALASNTSDLLEQLLRVGARSDPPSVHTCWDEVARTRGLVRAEVSWRRLPAGSERDTALASLGEAWRLAERRLARWEVRNAGSPRDAESDSALAALRADVDETERRLARVLPASASRGDPADLGIDSVLARLAPGQALVALTRMPDRGSGRLLAFVSRGLDHPPTCLDLGDLIQLQSAVDAWRAQLGEPDPALRSESACRRSGARVRASVWDPIARATRGASDIFLVPDGPVADIPWAALPVSGGKYLVESGVRLHVLDAERDLAEPRTERGGSGLLAVGGADYDREQTAAPPAEAALAASLRGPLTHCGAPLINRLQPLPGAAEEVRDVALAWSAGGASSGSVTILERDAATEAAFKRLAPGHQVVHLATHGIVLSDTCDATFSGARGVGGVSPLPATGPKGAASGAKSVAASAHGDVPARSTRSIPPSNPWSNRQTLLALANANHAATHETDENDGLLTAEEVATMDLRGTDWVVLSACRSGSGEIWGLQGVLGMRRAFLLAGARTVIASQWSVDDEATREWMRSLYQARARGALSAADAMASASRSVLQSRRRSHRPTHPFYWAAFTSSGE